MGQELTDFCKYIKDNPVTGFKNCVYKGNCGPCLYSFNQISLEGSKFIIQNSKGDRCSYFEISHQSRITYLKNQLEVVLSEIHHLKSFLED